MRIVVTLALLLGVAHADVPIVTTDDAIATAAAALATPDAKAAPGTGQKIAWIEKVADTKATEKRWRAQLATAKLTVLWSEVDAGSIAVVVEAPTKARAILTANIWATGGALVIVARPVLGAKLAGACVAIPQVRHEVRVSSRGVDQRGEHHRNEYERAMTTARLLDLDGDAIPDAFVPAPPSPSTCAESVPHRAYVMRGTCGHEVGVVGPGWFAPDPMTTPLGAGGLRSLTFSQETTRLESALRPGGPVPEHITVTRTFEAAKGRYTKTAESTRAGTCHHCSLWSCRAK